MQYFVNTKKQFGEYGPFAAESEEALADVMLEKFNEWARDGNDAAGAIVEIAQMRESFLDGVESYRVLNPGKVVVCDCCDTEFLGRQLAAMKEGWEFSTDGKMFACFDCVQKSITPAEAFGR